MPPPGHPSPTPPEPSYAERVRTMISLASVATLSTLSRKHPGFPFGSLMPFATDQAGRPIFLISNMAMHTQNLKADPRSSLFVGQVREDEDVLGTARATIVGQGRAGSRRGSCLRTRDLPGAASEQQLLGRLRGPSASSALEPVDLYYVGGFGVMGWVGSEDFQQASPDPLAPAAQAILTHMNADHVEAMILLARVHSGLEASEAAMTSVDRLGFTLRLKTAEGIEGHTDQLPARSRRRAADPRRTGRDGASGALKRIADWYKVGCPTFATRLTVAKVGRIATASDEALYTITKFALAGSPRRPRC